MKVARSGTPSVLWRMPSAVDSSRLVSASIGKGRFRRSGWSFRQARWTKWVSVLAPRTCASRSAKSAFCFPNSAISVGQMKVKSIGQKKTTFHFPA